MKQMSFADRKIRGGDCTIYWLLLVQPMTVRGIERALFLEPGQGAPGNVANTSVADRLYRLRASGMVTLGVGEGQLEFGYDAGPLFHAVRPDEGPARARASDRRWVGEDADRARARAAQVRDAGPLFPRA